MGITRFGLIVKAINPNIESILSQPAGSREGEEVVVSITPKDLPQNNTTVWIHMAFLLARAQIEWQELQNLDWGCHPAQSRETLERCLGEHVEEVDYTSSEGEELLESLSGPQARAWNDVPFIDRIISLRIVPPIPEKLQNPILERPPNPRPKKKRRTR